MPATRRTLLTGLAAAPLTAVAAQAMPALELAEDGSPIATVEQLAAMELEPWDRSESTPGFPPKPTEWVDLWNPVGVTLRISYEMMHKTKAELMEIIDSQDDDFFAQMRIGFDSAIGFLKAALAVMDGADVRLMVAASACAMRDGNLSEP
jgi:hypothetical protein